MQQQWSAVDNFMISSLIPEDDILSQVLENNKRAGLPEHDVAANQGQFLALLVRITQARRIPEIGTLGAYSAIWMARAARRRKADYPRGRSWPCRGGAPEYPPCGAKRAH